MHVFRHDDVPEELEAVFISYMYNRLNEDGFCVVRVKERYTVVTAGGYKVYVVREIKPDEFTHFYCVKTAGLKPCGTRASGIRLKPCDTPHPAQG